MSLSHTYTPTHSLLQVALPEDPTGAQRFAKRDASLALRPSEAGVVDQVRRAHCTAAGVCTAPRAQRALRAHRLLLLPLLHRPPHPDCLHATALPAGVCVHALRRDPCLSASLPACQVLLTTNEAGQAFVKVRVRTICIPQVRARYSQPACGTASLC